MAGAEPRGHLVGCARAIQAWAMVVTGGALDAWGFFDVAGLCDAGNLARPVFVGRATAGLCRFRVDNSRADRICADPAPALVPRSGSLLDLTPSGFTCFV